MRDRIMDKFTLDIRLGNDAMQAPGDIAQALREIANNVESLPDLDNRVNTRSVFDINGNRVGGWAAK